MRRVVVDPAAALLLADEAVDPRLRRDRRRPSSASAPASSPAISSTSFRRMAIGEARRIVDRDHEGARPADHAVLVVDVEIGDAVGAEGIARLQHDRQAVDGDALGDDAVADRRHRQAHVVRPVAGDVDGPADAASPRSRRTGSTRIPDPARSTCRARGPAVPPRHARRRPRPLPGSTPSPTARPSPGGRGRPTRHR